MNPSRNVGSSCSGFRLIGSTDRLRSWVIVFLGVFPLAGAANAAEEPRILKEIAWVKGHANARANAFNLIHIATLV